MLAPTSEGQDKQTRAQAGTHLLDVSAFLTHQRPRASQVPSSGFDASCCHAGPTTAPFQRLGIRMSRYWKLRHVSLCSPDGLFCNLYPKAGLFSHPHGSGNKSLSLKNPLSLNCTPNPVSLDILLTEMDSSTINGPLTSKCIWMQPLPIWNHKGRRDQHVLLVSGRTRLHSSALQKARKAFNVPYFSVANFLDIQYSWQVNRKIKEETWVLSLWAPGRPRHTYINSEDTQVRFLPSETLSCIELTGHMMGAVKNK